MSESKKHWKSNPKYRCKVFIVIISGKKYVVKGAVTRPLYPTPIPVAACQGGFTINFVVIATMINFANLNLAQDIRNGNEPRKL
ncbi:MAG: hypothetical protein NC242_08350 [Roseburia sp.]|nr:hypothetical protein [Roseburia sp.]